ncbi:hypothetical protein ACFULT_26400 [Rhodococcus sp. NPDC057297]|uniref:hypothetical protein n=1 Tax=Rhodococcus sp. NPDC057297 TaxID=3346090 RepID=UPI00363197A9
MNTVANLLHRLAYRIAPAQYTISESDHHGVHRLTINALGNRYVVNYGPQHPDTCDCE